MADPKVASGKTSHVFWLVGAFTGPSLLTYVKNLPDRGVDDWLCRQAARPSVAKPPLAVFLRRQK
jgi:hypothetical protein